MALKTLLFACLLVASMSMVAPMAESQVGGLAGLGGLGGLVSGLLGLIRIQGTLFCTIDGNMGVNGTTTPTFPNALVQLQCGGNVISTATTSGNGVFAILLDPLQFLLPSLLDECKLAVKTPLSSCNASFPSVGELFSSLEIFGSIVLGLLNITNIVPTGFTLLRT